MDERVFIKKCGRDQLGNTRTPDRPGRPGRDYLENEVEIVLFSPQGVYERREPTFNKKTAEIEYKFSVAEVISSHALELAGGRPYFIGTMADMPKDAEFRGAWFYDDETDPAAPLVGVDMDVAREIQKLRIKDLASLKIRKIDVFASDGEAQKLAIIEACKNFDLSGFQTTADLKGAFPPELA